MKRISVLMILLLMVVASWAQIEEKTLQVKNLVAEGVKLHDEGKQEEALKKFNAALKLDGTYATAYYEKAYTLFSNGNHKEAKKVLEKSLKKCKLEDLTLNYKLLGDIVDDEGNSRKAIEYYETAYRSNDDMGPKARQNILYNLGISYGRLMKQELDSCEQHANTALNCFRYSLSLNPKHAGSYYAFSSVITDENNGMNFGFSNALGMMGWYGFFGASHPSINKLIEMPDKWVARDITKEELDSMGPRTRMAYESVCEVAKKEPSEYGQLYDVYMYAIPKVADGYTDEPVPMQLVNKDMHDEFLWPLYAKIVREGMLETFCHIIAMRDKQHYIVNANWITKNNDALDKLVDMLNKGRYFDNTIMEEQAYGRVPSVGSVASADDAHDRYEEAILACKYYLNHYVGTEEMQKTSHFILSWAQASPDVSIPLGSGEAKWLNEQTMPYLIAYMAAYAIRLKDSKTKELTEEAYHDAVGTMLWYYDNNKDKTGTNEELDRLVNLLVNDRDAFDKELKSNFPGKNN